MTDVSPAPALRPIKPMTLAGVTMLDIVEDAPDFVWVDPRRELFVDPTYQRNLSPASITLIRKIVGNWSWKKFKPPIVRLAEDGKYEVIDGQHTAIAAASHRGIVKIPVCVITADTVEDRAQAFMGHNGDRIQVTSLQMFHAGLVAGNPEALQIRDVVEAAGARVPKSLRGSNDYKVGDTVALKVLANVVKARGGEGAIAALKVCVDARMKPVPAAAIRAVDLLLSEKDADGERRTHDQLVSAIMLLGPNLDKKTASRAAIDRVPLWQAMAAVIDEKVPK